MTGQLDADVRVLHDARQALVKARVVGGDRPAPLAEQAVDEDEQFDVAGALEPPYEPETLTMLLEHSNSLRQNIDAYVVNVHAHGHHYVPIIDLNADDANERISTLLWERKLREAGARQDLADPHEQVELPTEEEVEAARKELEEKMRWERTRLRRFFDNCSLDESFEALRMRTAMDKETLGNGFWEVLRDESGRIAQFNYISAHTMRLLQLDKDAIEVEEKVRVDDVTWGEVIRRKRFRRYVQVIEDGKEPVYFKDLGDPRLVSSKTGCVFDSTHQMRRTEGDDALAATEVLHFRIPSPRTAYGVPRWIGQLLSVLGSRQVDEVNFTYFDNKSVPPLLVTIADGRMTQEAVESMRTHIDSEIKGKRNFHKILVIEAVTDREPGQQHSGRARIDVKPLTMAQHNDALFQKYDERNMDKVGMAFRLPRMLRGDIRDFNRSTADAALEFAEMQVFAPEREDFDFVINRRVLPLLGIRFWRFRSNSPTLTDPVEQGKLITEMTKEGVLTPAEARQEAEKVLNRELPNIPAPWTRQPIPLTLAGIAPPAESMPDGVDGEDGEPAEAKPAAEVELTGTSLEAIVTVNEAREAKGYGPLKLANGEIDPDGYLTVLEFKYKRQAAGMAVGQGEGQAEIAGTTEGAPEEVKVLETGDLASGGGLLHPAQGTKDEDEMFHRRVVRDAAYLLRLRSAMGEAEAAEAQRSFEAARETERTEA